jgi:hypothetical protein
VSINHVSIKMEIIGTIWNVPENLILSRKTEQMDTMN